MLGRKRVCLREDFESALQVSSLTVETSQGDHHRHKVRLLFECRQIGCSCSFGISGLRLKIAESEVGSCVFRIFFQSRKKMNPGQLQVPPREVITPLLNQNVYRQFLESAPFFTPKRISQPRQIGGPKIGMGNGFGAASSCEKEKEEQGENKFCHAEPLE